MNYQDITKTLVCTSPYCHSPGVVEDYDIHDSHQNYIMTVAKLNIMITPSKPNFQTFYERD
jgi:hypothetical protein